MLKHLNEEIGCPSNLDPDEAANFIWYLISETANCSVFIWVPSEADPQQGRLQVVDLKGESLKTPVKEGKSGAGKGGSLSGKLPPWELELNTKGSSESEYPAKASA